MNILHMFTDNFPYGKGEAFIEDEVEVLSKKFDSIIIYPISTNGELRDLPANVFVQPSLQSMLGENYIKVRFEEKIMLTSILISEWASRRFSVAFLKQVLDYSGVLFKAYRSGVALENSWAEQKINRANDNHYLSSFWFAEWATILSLMRHRKAIKSYVSRAHSFDIYEEYFWKGSIIPFRYFQLSNVNKVLTDSKVGCEYLRRKFPAYNSKIDVGYMGGKDYGLNEFKNDDTLKILTCSFVNKRKRVNRLVEVLAELKMKVRWVHIGDGEGLDLIKKACDKLPSNVSIEFKGYLSKTEMVEFYLNNSIDLFIHLSEKEGVPTAVIDACSFGVPVIATDAGGTAEIINESTGQLIPLYFENSQLIDFLKKFKSSTFNTVGFRNKVKTEWARKFQSNANYDDFYRFLLLQPSFL